jgi:hypothetical protein
VPSSPASANAPRARPDRSAAEADYFNFSNPPQEKAIGSFIGKGAGLTGAIPGNT